MQGLELARAFWETYREELFSGDLVEYADRAAAGLVGEGSECWGYDDEASRDHDWGPGCCIWLTRDDYALIAPELQRRYDACASRPLAGFAPRPPAAPGSQRRVGVFRVEAFYVQLLPQGMPQGLDGWRSAREHALAAATNGQVFCDGAGRFTEIRDRLLAYYPDDLRLHRIAHGCVIAAQAGQYNLPRQMARGEELAALAALSRFQDAAERIAYALARRYRPFYKWSSRGLLDVSELGRELHALLSEALGTFRAGDARSMSGAVERTCERIARELVREGLSDTPEPWLLAQAEQVNAHVQDEGLRAADLMEP